MALAAAAPARAASPPRPAPAAAAASPNKAPIVPLTQVHASSYDVRLRVDGDGAMTAEHVLSLRVLSGAMKSLELKARDPNVTAVAPVEIVSEEGKGNWAGTIAVREDGTIRIEPLEEKGLKRGNYKLRFALKTDLVKTGSLRRDGVLYRLAWTSPAMSEGIDGMRVVFDLPAAPTEPRAAGAGDGIAPSEEGLLTTLRRGPNRDELEIVRPRVARGEAVVWEARVDPRALPALRAPTLTARREAPPLAPTPESPSYALVSIFALAITLLAFAKERAEHSLLAARTLSPLVRGPAWLRVALAGACATGAALLVLAEENVWGGLVAIAASTLFLRRARSNASPAARGPGEWLVLRPHEAFDRTRSLFSIESARGIALLFALLCLTAVALWFGGALDARAPILAAIAATFVAAAFATPSDDEMGAARGHLARAYRKLSRERSLKVVPFVRVPKGKSAIEEVRVRALPRHPMPGVVSVELGAAGDDLEVLVRVRDESPAARKLAVLAKGSRALPGRAEGERVVALTTHGPSISEACALVRRMAEAFVERREADEVASETRANAARAAHAARYEGPERRGILPEPFGGAQSAATA